MRGLHAIPHGGNPRDSSDQKEEKIITLCSIKICLSENVFNYIFLNAAKETLKGFSNRI